MSVSPHDLGSNSYAKRFVVAIFSPKQICSEAVRRVQRWTNSETRQKTFGLMKNIKTKVLHYTSNSNCNSTVKRLGPTSIRVDVPRFLIRSKRSLFHLAPYSTAVPKILAVSSLTKRHQLVRKFVDPFLQHGLPNAQVVLLASHAILSTLRASFLGTAASLALARMLVTSSIYTPVVVHRVAYPRIHKTTMPVAASKGTSFVIRAAAEAAEIAVICAGPMATGRGPADAPALGASTSSTKPGRTDQCLRPKLLPTEL